MKRCKLCDGQIRQTKYEGFCYQCWHDNDGDYGGMVGIIEGVDQRFFIKNSATLLRCLSYALVKKRVPSR